MTDMAFAALGFAPAKGVVKTERGSGERDERWGHGDRLSVTWREGMGRGRAAARRGELGRGAGPAVRARARGGEGEVGRSGWLGQLLLLLFFSIFPPLSISFFQTLVLIHVYIYSIHIYSTSGVH